VRENKDHTEKCEEFMKQVLFENIHDNDYIEMSLTLRNFNAQKLQAHKE